MKSDHEPLMGYDGDSWTLNCLCGKFLGQHDTAGEAGDAFEDHVAGVYER